MPTHEKGRDRKKETWRKLERQTWGHGGMSRHMPVVKKVREMRTYRGTLEGSECKRERELGRESESARGLIFNVINWL